MLNSEKETLRLGLLKSRRRADRLWIAIGIVFPLTVFGAAAVLANYIGPNRTYTTTEYHREYCNYRAVTNPPAAFRVCNLTLYNSPGSCPGNVAGYFNNAATACGTSWPGTCGSSIGCTISLLGSGEEGCSSGEPGCTAPSAVASSRPPQISGSTW